MSRHIVQVSPLAQTATTPDGKTVVEVAGRTLFQLNRVGLAIWTGLKEELTTQEILARLTTQFDAPKERVAEDVAAFIDTLKRNDLVQENVRTPNFRCELVWDRGIAARCDWRIPEEFLEGLGFATAMEPGMPYTVPPNWRGDLISDPEIYREVKDGDLVWVKISWLKSFVEQVLPLIQSKFVLVTAGSDIGPPLDMMAEALQILERPTVIHWYAQNCDGPGFMGRMSPIPIGINFHNTSQQSMWGEDVSSPEEQERALMEIRKELRPARERIPKVYIDFAWQPHNKYQPGKRQRVIYRLLNNPCAVFQARPIPRRDLWRKWGEYAFVLSPHGHGLDCHRTWEALACGNIVLVPSSPLDCLYEGLPVIPIKDWSQITPENLDAWLELHSGCEIGDERLTSNYWVCKMRAAAKRKMSSGSSIELERAHRV